MITGIIVALPEELSTLTAKKIPKGECDLITKNVLVAHSGTGPVNAAKATQRLIEKGSCKIISWGCAAALNSSLKAGDLCLPRILISENQEQHLIEASWHKHASELLSGLQTTSFNPVVESSRIISSSTEKQTLFHDTSADALDMESAAIGRSTQIAGIPLLVIRVIADTAHMDLPEAINSSLSDQGQIDSTKLLVNIIQNPGQIPSLVKLGIHFYSARRQLKLIAKKLNDITSFSPHRETQATT